MNKYVNRLILTVNTYSKSLENVYAQKLKLPEQEKRKFVQTSQKQTKPIRFE